MRQIGRIVLGTGLGALVGWGVGWFVTTVHTSSWESYDYGNPIMTVVVATSIAGALSGLNLKFIRYAVGGLTVGWLVFALIESVYAVEESLVLLAIGVIVGAVVGWIRYGVTETYFSSPSFLTVPVLKVFQARGTNRSSYGRPLVSMIFIVLTITSAVFSICFGIGMLLIAQFLANNAYVLAGVSFLIVAVISARVLGPLVYRIAARAFPLGAAGRVNSVSLRILKGTVVLMLVGCLGTSYVGLESLSFLLFSTDTGLEAALRHAYEVIAVVLSSIVLLFFGCIAYGLLKSIRLHQHPGAWVDDGFVLFLRSFGSVGDTATLGPLVRAAGRNLRVALLSSPKDLMTSWDLRTLAISGFSWRHPFRSTPVYLESTERSWTDDIRRLAATAQLVVVDTSRQTPGLSKELEILNESGVEDKVLQIQESTEREVMERAPTASRKRVVAMTRSHAMRRFSQVLSFVFTYLGFVILTGVGVTVLDPFWSSGAGSVILWSSLVYSIFPAIWSTSAFSPTAGFTHHSSRELVRAMQQHLAHVQT